MAEVRDDVLKVLKEDGTRCTGVTRRLLSAASDIIPADNTVVAVMVGQVARYHPLIPVPEQGAGALIAAESGVAVAQRIGFASHAAWLPWEALVHAMVNMSALSGVVVDLATEKHRYVLTEAFRGPATARHARLMSRVFAEHLQHG